MPPFSNDESSPPDDDMSRSSSSILSHKSLSYVRIETKVADAETLSTRLLEDYSFSDDDDDSGGGGGGNYEDCSFNSKRSFTILCCLYMFLVTANIIVLSSTEDFDSDKWWKVSNICNVVSGYLGILGAIYRSKLIVFLVSSWWLFEMFFGMFRLAFMYWSIIPDTAAREWFIAYTVISYIVRLLLVCSATMFVSHQSSREQQQQQSEEVILRTDSGAQVVFV